MVSTGLIQNGGNDWISIQISTFTQWVNQNLRKVDREIFTLNDFIDGTNLVALVEVLLSRRLGRIMSRPINDFQRAENVNKALAALNEDGIRLVNIGSEDIIGGNQKLILGLMWQLILKYQIGGSRSDSMHPKKRMLEWLQSALPEQNIRNFTTDWNNGKALLALLEYCRPGITESEDSGVFAADNGLEDCRLALDIANRVFQVPAILSGEDLNSPQLDELSCMTYLSYFMNEGSPGYNATLNWVNKQLPPGIAAEDFNESFRDGTVLCHLVTSLGCGIPGWPKALLQSSSSDRINKAVAVANSTYGISCPFSAYEVTSNNDSDHLKVMAYCSRLRNAVGEEFTPVTMTTVSRTNKPRIFIESAEDGEVIEGILMANPKHLLSDDASLLPNRVNEPVNVHLQLDEPVYVPERVCFFVDDPDDRAIHLDQRPSWSEDRCSATLAFIPTRPGRHLVRVEGERLHVAPLQYDVIDDAEFVRVVLPNTWTEGAEPMTEQRVGLELGDVDEKRIRAQWTDPSGRRHTLRVDKDPATQKHRLLITPDSSGTWELFVTCDGRPVPGSPFPLDVLSPVGLPSKSPVNSRRSSTLTSSSHTSGVYNLLDSTDGPGGELTMWSSEPLRENRDCCVNVRLGDREGELSALVTKHGMVVPSDVLPREERSVQQVRFRPDEPGEYKVTVFLGGQIGSSIFHLKRSLNSAAIRCSGPGLKIVPIETETWFRIHADGDAETARLSVKLTEPNGHHQIMFFEWREKERGAFEMKWYPKAIGIFYIAVLYNGTEISRSPFKVICIDLAKVWIDTTGIQADVEYPFKVSADLTDSGASILTVRAVEKKSIAEIPCEVTIVNRGSMRNCLNCMVTPPSPGIYLLHLEIYGYPLPVSPLICVAKPPDKDTVRVIAPQEAPVGASIVIEIQGINKPKAVALRVMAPHGDAVRMEGLARNVQSGGLSCSFVAYFVGSYILTAEHKGEMISGSPQSILVYDMSRVRARLETPTVLLGEEATMIVEAENRIGIVTVLACVPSAPAIEEGDARFVEMSPWMDDQGSTLLSSTPHTMVVRDPDQHGIHRVSCLPMEPGLHVLHIDFDGSPVKGSPFELLCIDPARITVVSEGSSSVHVNNLAWFRIDVKGAPLKFLNISVVDPNDVPMACALTQEGVAVHCEYRPTVVGDYTVQVSYAGHILRGCPFFCHAYNAEGVRVPTWAPMGVVDHDLHFKVDCSKAGRGHLKVRVLSLADWQKFPLFSTGGLPVHLTNESDFSSLSYKVTPEEIGVHIIEIFFNGQLIPDCPLLPHIFTAEEALLWPQIPHRNYCSINQRTEVDFNCYGVHFYSDLNYTAFIKAPSGNFIATEVRESHEKIVVDYTPREVGRHQLEVCLDKENVFGSPFEVDVFDANAVKVYYEPLVEINEETYFEVDLSRAGRAPLDCCVFSPTGEAVSLTSPHDNHTISSDPRLRFSYCPREAGPHRLGVHFGETEVPLSPFLQQAVREIGSQGREEEPAVMQPVAYGEGLIRAETDWPAVFFVDPKNKKGDLFVKVDGPNSVAKCNIEPEGVTGKYRVTYVPTVVGRYAVNVEWNKQSVPNSPFRPIVVAPGMVHCPDLRFSSSRPLDPLIVGRKKELVCSTEDAGPGTMRAEVRGPGGAPLSVRVKERDNGAVVVRFTPAHPGPHRLSLFWGELPLPGIPFEGEAVNEQPLDHSKVILSGRGLKEARVNEEAEFIIDGKQAGPGRPTILMKGVHTEVDVEMESVLEHRYKCSYVPTVVGAYLLTIWWSERQLRGSPFKVTVVAPSDASKVVCSGDGLSHGVLGEEMDCQIDTRRAGPGELTALCSGGQKVAYCELYDHRDGTYSLKIKPQETGRHVLQIKFGGEHVHGSPFIARVSNAPDASCVRVFGPGVEHGILDNFQSRFIVETRGAGAGQLTVRVRGPRGAFRVEMERETRKDRTILCRYDPTEPGEYWINITWSGHHVPGSPFRVMLFEKKEELRMFARANGLSLDEERSQWQEHL